MYDDAKHMYDPMRWSCLTVTRVLFGTMIWGSSSKNTQTSLRNVASERPMVGAAMSVRYNAPTVVWVRLMLFLVEGAALVPAWSAAWAVNHTSSTAYRRAGRNPAVSSE